MRKFAAAVTAITILIAATPGMAQDAGLTSVAAPPDLIGTWAVVRSEGAFGTEIVGTLPRAELIIDMQEGAVFAGASEYELGTDDPDFHDGSAPVRVAIEPFTGVVGWDNRSLTIVERGDTSVWTGSLLNAETMALVYYEPGEHAFIARQILVRK